MASQVVPINSVKPHPMNPRKGDVDAIAESLDANTQYRGITVQKSTSYIIAGNHTWKAAKQLGWKQVKAKFIDVDDDEALRIMLDDNDSWRRGLTDERAAVSLLSTMDSLYGTGYTMEDLRMPDLPPMILEPEDEMPSVSPGDAEPVQKPPMLQVGRIKGLIAPEAYTAWRETLPEGKRAAVKELLELLSLTEPPEKKPEPPAPVVDEDETYPLADLALYPGNPRQGDISHLMGRLQDHGQYKDVVVNRLTNRVLAGNNLCRAAKALEWKTVSVSWVEVSEEDEKRIVLADNRTSELGTTDPNGVGRIFAQLKSVEGTGFRLEDLQGVLGATEYIPKAKRAGTWTIRVGDLSAKVKLHLVEELNLTGGQELVEVALMVGLDPKAVTPV